MGPKDAAQHGELVPVLQITENNSTGAFAFGILNFDQKT